MSIGDFLVDFYCIFSSWAEEGERSDTNFSDIGEADSVSSSFLSNLYILSKISGL
jgi:hypothetical protein